MGAFSTVGMAQSLPFDFEAAPTTSDFVDFDGGTATVVANPSPTTANNSTNVARMVRNGGQVWGGSKVLLSGPLDFTLNSTLEMKVYTSAPAGTVVKLKLEDSNGGFAEVDQTTTATNQWETLQWDFTGTPVQFDQVVFMFDFGNVGDGSATSTFYFDDVMQIYSGAQIDWPVDFEGTSVNYTMSDFGGNQSQMAMDPEDFSNHVIEVLKPVGAATWAGTTIGTPAGFATDLPLSMTESFMTVRVWSPDAGTPIRLKVEDSDDPTHTCETETNTTVSKQWETLLFDFTNQAPGTELLSVGLSMGWTYNMASIFFNFGTDGTTAGPATYFFDDVAFGSAPMTAPESPRLETAVYPNPSVNQWTVESAHRIDRVTVFNTQGQMVFEAAPARKKMTISNESWTPGVYFLQIESGGEQSHQRIIKK